MPPRPRATPRHLATSPFARPADVEVASARMAPDDRVTHDRYGLGSVVRIVDDHDVIVNFGAEDGSYRSVAHIRLTVL